MILLSAAKASQGNSTLDVLNAITPLLVGLFGASGIFAVLGELLSHFRRDSRVIVLTEGTHDFQTVLNNTLVIISLVLSFLGFAVGFIQLLASKLWPGLGMLGASAIILAVAVIVKYYEEVMVGYVKLGDHFFRIDRKINDEYLLSDIRIGDFPVASVSKLVMAASLSSLPLVFLLESKHSRLGYEELTKTLERAMKDFP